MHSDAIIIYAKKPTPTETQEENTRMKITPTNGEKGTMIPIYVLSSLFMPVYDLTKKFATRNSSKMSRDHSIIPCPTSLQHTSVHIQE